MRMKGKKPIFNYKDTFSMDATLNPIIHAGLTKFADTIEEKINDPWIGVPSSVLADYFPDHDVEDEITNDHVMKWIEIVREMAFAFSDYEPDPGDYGFEIEFIGTSDHPKEEVVVYTRRTRINNQDEWDRYGKDIELARKRADKGRELFAKYYNDLWW